MTKKNSSKKNRINKLKKMPSLLSSEAVKKQLSIVGMLSDWNKRSDKKNWHLTKSTEKIASI